MEQNARENQVSVQRERAVLVACLLPDMTIDPHDPLGELRSLADTAGAVVVDQLIQNRQKREPATFIGKGKVQELAAMVKFHKAEVVVFDNDLSPSQIGNIEKEIECKVLDRSELILDIFAARARTHEARLQVELAQLIYTYPRLRAMWTHLERIAGGAPAGIGTRGPGEQQLEIDRRIVQQKKSELKRELVRVQARKEREVAARIKDHFTVGLVGYTNAGKSTLFNKLTTDHKGGGGTGGGAYADDKLFATLSTRTRKWDLGQGKEVMLSDTVGFVRDLPHHLVASFKATLEEAVHAHLLLIVLDVSHANAKQQLDTVFEVLDDIGANGEKIKGGQKRLLLLNKTDKLEHNADILYFQKIDAEALAISALSGVGIEELKERVRAALRGGLHTRRFEVALSDGKAQHFLESRCDVIDRAYGEDSVTLTVSIGDRQFDQFQTMGSTARLLGSEE